MGIINRLKTLRPEVDNAPKINLVVVKANDHEVLTCVEQACQESRVYAYLIDDKEKLTTSLQQYNLPKDSYEIIDEADDQQASSKAVELVRNNKGDAILKGHLATGKILKEVVNKETGIRKAQTLSHVAIIANPKLEQLLAVTDGGLILQPDFNSGKVIIENSVTVMRALHYEKVKIALLSCAENIIPKLPSSVLEAELTEEFKDNDSDVIVEGPLSIDLALSSASAEEKGYAGQIKGDANVLFAPDIVTGNTVSKSMLLFGDSEMAGVIMGAQVPVIITSRSSSYEEKYASILLAQILMLDK